VDNGLVIIALYYEMFMINHLLCFVCKNTADLRYMVILFGGSRSFCCFIQVRMQALWLWPF